MTEAFDFDGEAYGKASDHQREWGCRLIDDLSLRGDERILDLGCGDGKLSCLLADRVPAGSVLGVDASAGMLEAARWHRRANLRFDVLDINRLDFTEAFDVVFSNAALHWIHDHRKLLDAICHALAPGGTARLSFAADGNCAALIRAIRRTMATPEFAPRFETFQWPWHMPTVEQYRRLATAAAFEDIRIWEENADRLFPTAEAITAWIDQPSLVPFLQHLPARLRSSFRDPVVADVLRETRRPAGGHFETFRRLNVLAHKPGTA